MKNFKKKDGITLIALVVTIVSYLALESVFRLFRDSMHPENKMHNDNTAKYLIMSHLTS